MSINGTIGNVAYYQGEAIILGKSAAYINCGKDLSRSYLFFLLQSEAAGNFFKSMSSGTTIFNLSLESIRKFPVALPSLNEQEQIVAYIDQEISKLNTIDDFYDRQLTLLTEYRAALIHECVTGQHLIPEAASP